MLKEILKKIRYIKREQAIKDNLKKGVSKEYIEHVKAENAEIDELQKRFA